MDAAHFDQLLRLMNTGASRRRLLHGFAAALGGSAASVPYVATVGKRKKKLRRNAFGCVSIGGMCRGKDRVCCSGRCDGKKPGRGEKDRSRCVAHDTGGCRAGQRNQRCGGVDIQCRGGVGLVGVCETTTGNAPYCASGYSCVPCATDEDCRSICGPRAACLPCGYYCDGPVCAGPEACTGSAENARTSETVTSAPPALS
jgi:hypothetical protein